MISITAVAMCWLNVPCVLSTLLHPQAPILELRDRVDPRKEQEFYTSTSEDFSDFTSLRCVANCYISFVHKRKSAGTLENRMSGI